MTKESRQVRRARERAEAKSEAKSKKTIMVGYYWGYKADLLTPEVVKDPKRLRESEGFEFTQRHLEMNGITPKQAMKTGRSLKDAVDHNVAIYTEGRTQEEYGITEDEFLQTTQMNLQDCIRSFNGKVASKAPIKDTLKDIFMVCIAISTLVAAGKIEQSEYNGDKFSWASMPGNMAEDFYKEEAA